MASYLVDSSALLDIFTTDPVWSDWSIQELEKAWTDGAVFIGAHAAVSDMVLITRDPGRVRAYFPTLRITNPAL